MKKYFALFAIAATIIISASCSKKEDPEPDIAATVVGDYLGTLTVGDDVFTDVHVMVSRLSKSRIQIVPDSHPVFFYANLVQVFSDFTLNVPSQVVSAGTLGSVAVIGNDLLVPGDPNAHGSYTASNNKLIYSVNFHINSSDVPSDFQGIKQ
jgi:hypothetical protein